MRDVLRLAVTMGREVAEDVMVDTCVVRTTAGVIVDEETGAVTPVPGPIVYGPTVAPHRGRCLVKAVQGIAGTPEVAGATLFVQRLRLDVPVGAFDVAKGMHVLIVAAQLDPYLAGREYRVTQLPNASATTKYRIGIEAVS